MMDREIYLSGVSWAIERRCTRILRYTGSSMMGTRISMALGPRISIRQRTVPAIVLAGYT